MTTAFQIKGFDCAACGVKAEDAIKKLSCVNHAVVDFTNLRLHLDTNDVKCVCNEIKRINSGAEIIPPQDSADTDRNKCFRKDKFSEAK